MKYLIIIFILLLTHNLSFAQGSQEEVPVVANWSKGDSYTFRVTNIERRWRHSELTKNDSSTYKVNFEVIDATTTNYKIKWQYKTDLSKFNVSPETHEKFAKYQTTEVVYLTSNTGEFLEIENWEEVAKMMKDLFADLSELFEKENPASNNEVLNAIQSISRIYESKQAIEQIVFKEIQFFHFLMGGEYSVKEPLLYEEQLPNLVGGKPIRGDSKIYVASVDFKKSLCMIIKEMSLNPDDTKNFITAIFQQMKLGVEEMEAAMKTAQFDIKDYGKYEYYFDLGIPRKIDNTRESIVDIGNEKGKRLDIIRIELVE